MIFVIGGRNQGKTRFVSENFPEKKIINAFHEIMRNGLKEGKTADNILNSVLETYDVIICDEIGCGIVPTDRFERIWREETGRAMCKIADQAEAVYRIYAGIVMKIK